MHTKYFNLTEERRVEDLMENEAFCTGVTVGINIHQQKVIMAHERKEPLKIGDEIYFLQTGRERLEEVLNRICE